MLSNSRLQRLLALLTAALLAAGCTRHSEQADEQVSLGREDPDCLILIAVDLSGSFLGQMAKDGKGYEFTLRVADNYFRNSIGTNNRIVLAQLSATDRALLWDGTPLQLRHDFPTAARFRDFLINRSNPAGSRIHAGVADALEYVMCDPGVMKGKTRTAVFVLSDFIDTFPDSDQSEQRLMQALRNYAKTNGALGFYFLDQFQVSAWRRRVQESGVRRYVVESEIVAYPPLPTFE